MTGLDGLSILAIIVTAAAILWLLLEPGRRWVTPPTLPDDGTDNDAWAEALRYPPWRLIGPDTFANFTQDAGRECPDSLSPAASLITLSHEMLNSAEVQQNPDAR